MIVYLGSHGSRTALEIFVISSMQVDHPPALNAVQVDQVPNMIKLFRCYIYTKNQSENTSYEKQYTLFKIYTH